MIKGDGYYRAKIHGMIKYIKVIDGEPHVLDTEKGKPAWCKTLIVKEVLRRFNKISELELVQELLRLNRIVYLSDKL